MAEMKLFWQIGEITNMSYVMKIMIFQLKFPASLMFYSTEVYYAIAE